MTLCNVQPTTYQKSAHLKPIRIDRFQMCTEAGTTPTIQYNTIERNKFVIGVVAFFRRCSLNRDDFLIHSGGKNETFPDGH